MRAFIQYSTDGLPTNINTFCALKGFDLLGSEIVPFTSTDMEVTTADLSLCEGDVLCGYVAVVHHAFAKLGIPQPRLKSWPDELVHHLGRRVWESTLGEIRASERPVFLKPAVDDKAFPGHVRNVGAVDAVLTAHLDDTIQVVCSEPVEFVSEWRCFVVDGQAIDVRRYRGSFRTPQPDFAVLDDCLARFANAPRGYAIDLGVTKDSRTLLVEVNDGYSLASYGLDPLSYARLLATRWSDLVASVSD